MCKPLRKGLGLSLIILKGMGACLKHILRLHRREIPCNNELTGFVLKLFFPYLNLCYSVPQHNWIGWTVM